MNKNNNLEKKPWLDENGSMYPDSVIREIQKDWTPAIYDQFLKETIDVPLRETILDDPNQFNRLAERNQYSTFYPEFDDGRIEVPAKAKDYLEIAINELDETEKRVINGIFYEELTQVEIADELGITQCTVHSILERALNNLREIILESDGEKLINIQKNEFQQIKEQNSDELIDEINQILEAI